MFTFILNLANDYEENRNYVDSIIGLIGALIILVIVYLYARKTIFGPIAKSWSKGIFPKELKYSPENLLKAYICLGVSMVKREKDDSLSQMQYLHRYLKTHFSHVAPFTFEDVKSYYFLKVSAKSTLEWLKINQPQDYKVQILDYLVNLAFHNQSLSKKEHDLLKLTALHLEIDKNTYDSIVGIRMDAFRRHKENKKKFKKKSSVQHQSKRDKYLKILGLSGNPSADEIKKTYRQLAKKFHPDKFVKMGEDELKMANERFAAINNAYDYLNEQNV